MVCHRDQLTRLTHQDKVSAQALRQADVDRAGITVESGGESIERQVPVNSGRDLLKVNGWKTQDGREFWPDPGFDRAPGLKAHEATERLFTSASRIMPPAQALATVQKAASTPLARQAWAGFVKDAMASPVSRGRAAVLGVLSEADLAAALGKGKPADSPVVYVEDKLFAGKKARRHKDAGDALIESEWIDLAEQFSKPARTFWDTRFSTLVKIYPSKSASVKVAVDVGRFKLVDSLKANRAATVYKVSDEDIEQAIRSGWFEEMK